MKISYIQKGTSVAQIMQQTLAASNESLVHDSFTPEECVKWAHYVVIQRGDYYNPVTQIPQLPEWEFAIQDNQWACSAYGKLITAKDGHQKIEFQGYGMKQKSPSYLIEDLPNGAGVRVTYEGAYNGLAARNALIPVGIEHPLAGKGIRAFVQCSAFGNKPISLTNYLSHRLTNVSYFMIQADLREELPKLPYQIQKLEEALAAIREGREMELLNNRLSSLLAEWGVKTEDQVADLLAEAKAKQKNLEANRHILAPEPVSVLSHKLPYQSSGLVKAVMAAIKSPSKEMWWEARNIAEDLVGPEKSYNLVGAIKAALLKL